MKAGSLNKRITFQSKTVTYDAVNQPIETWADTARSVPASIATTGSRELYEAQKLRAETTAVFKVRFTRGITELMRIKYENRIFEILGRPEDVNGMRQTIQISAKEVS